MKINNLSIILQGLPDKDHFEHMFSFLNYTDDVIFVTWKGQDSSVIEKLRSGKIEVIELNDPGSITSYEQSGLRKSFNVNRRVVAFREGLLRAKNQLCIISRTDISFDAKMCVESYLDSGRTFGITNVNSINPYRLFAEKRYLSFSDWLYIGYKDSLQAMYETKVDESKFLSKNVIRTFSANYFGKINSEQALSSLLIGSLDLVLTGDKDLKDFHHKFLASCCIIDWKKISLKSTKYNHFTYSWVSYYKLTSEEETFQIPLKRLRHLPLYLVAKIAERI